MRAVVLIFAALVVVGCHFDSPIFTPPKNDPAYHCFTADGTVLVDSTWCFPVDGTHTCCAIGGACIKDGCEYPENDHTFGAKRSTARVAERP